MEQALLPEQESTVTSEGKLITILPPASPKRKWVAVIGGIEVSANNEQEVRDKAVALVLADPFVLQAVLDVIDETYRRNVSSENWHSRIRNSLVAKFAMD